MKRLAVLRHAKAEPGDEERDFDRRLDGRGHAQAAAVASELEQRGLNFDAVIASPAVRVRETLAGLGGLPDVQFERSLYLATPGASLALIRALPETEDQALVAGHNPAMQELVLMLARPGPLSDRVAARYPTAALALIEFDCESWAEVAPGAGRLAELIIPDELKA